MERSRRISVESLCGEGYRDIICYPRYEIEELQNRLTELRELGIESVEFTGNKIVRNIPVLGKGNVGLVVIAYGKMGKAALKIRRVDADRFTMQHEAQMLQMANEVNVGPRLLGLTPNFLLMAYIKGSSFHDWMTALSGGKAKRRLQNTLSSILEQAWKLDHKGVDHGQLSNAEKHVIVDPNDIPQIVDFETASTSRQVSNLTSICNYLFLRDQIAEPVQERIGWINRNSLITALRAYKSNRSRESFVQILETCTLFEAPSQTSDTIA
ncbi:MAG: serine/threonine protein kinase [Candidatus Bathyarchaeota archaeon]|nr:MAG: serine/threonine protein kinase [Candidatus Bathyarchaeota archaeon]